VFPKQWLFYWDDDDRGFINYTVDFSKTNVSNRPGTVDAAGEAADFGANITDVREFLSRNQMLIT
jgi:iron complex outermembrane receptor protein